MKTMIALATLLAMTGIAQTATTTNNRPDIYGGLFGSATDPVRVVTLQAPLSSTSENPASDRTGSGMATVTIRMDNPASGTKSATVQVQMNLHFAMEETVTMAHIHKGALGVNGPVVVDFKMTTPTTSAANQNSNLSFQFEVTDATTLAALEEVISNPNAHYVNVHSTSKPGGIVRGQLGDSAIASSRRLEERFRTIAEPDLRDIKRLVVLMAYQQGIIGGAERDSMLATLAGR